MSVIADDDLHQITESIWLAIAGLAVERVDPDVVRARTGSTFAGCVHVTGAWSGAIALHCSEPLARRVAAALGVDVGAIEGTGPRGAITRVDVERAAHAAEAPLAPAPEAPAAPAPPPAAERRAPAEKLDALRAAVGALMARSKREIPHFHLQRTIDMTAALEALDAFNAERAPQDRVLPAALLLCAAARAVHDVPEVNGTHEDGTFRPAPGVRLGVAVSLRGGGVIAPAIGEADTLDPVAMMAALRGVTTRARRGALLGSDLSGATLPVTSLGDHGADLVEGVIFPPQVGLVGFGRIDWRPVARDGMLAARRTVIATFAGDHRVSDGHSGSLYLEAIDHDLQDPFGHDHH
jgi:pyruvate dehydrogenase E2 component (dihydrolipoamide acetyltransferase)